MGKRGFGGFKMPSFSMPVNLGDIGNIGNIGGNMGEFKMPDINKFANDIGGFTGSGQLSSGNKFSANFTTGSLDDIKTEAMDKFRMQYGDNPQVVAEMERMIQGTISEAATKADDMFKDAKNSAMEQWGIDPSTTINIRK